MPCKKILSQSSQYSVRRVGGGGGGVGQKRKKIKGREGRREGGEERSNSRHFNCYPGKQEGKSGDENKECVKK
jgi:hypothetical protein